MIKLYNGSGELEITLTSTGRTIEITDDELNELSTTSDDYKELLEDFNIAKEENKDMLKSIEEHLEGIRTLEDALGVLKDKLTRREQRDILADIENILENEVDILGRFI